MIRYTTEHLWVRQEKDGASATVGITRHAQETLGDIVLVELPALGRHVQGTAVGVVESTKTAADLHMPATGDIVECNQVLVDQPELLNTDPMGAGWVFRLDAIEAGQFDALMDEAAYAAFAG
ncbi:glycine cleavage system protein GcvH [Variovorax paradoxus]|nr:glycine cleavage system protein GcvH [Variovorax paradoxus]